MTTTRTPQRSLIADDLLRSIRNQQLPIGSKLPSERQLADQYGVSRTVVREALRMLSTLDVIDVQMGRGAFVTSSDVSTEAHDEYSLIDIIDAREAIERGAIRLATARADADALKHMQDTLASLRDRVRQGRDTAELDLELHRSVVGAARSLKLMRLWTDMTAEIAQTIRVSPHGRSMNEDIFRDHEALVGGVLEGDVTAADEACSRLYAEHRAFLRSLLGG